LGAGLTIQPCKKVTVMKPQKGRPGPVFTLLSLKKESEAYGITMLNCLFMMMIN
jgi:hypothetical protein